MLVITVWPYWPEMLYSYFLIGRKWQSSNFLQSNLFKSITREPGKRGYTRIVNLRPNPPFENIGNTFLWHKFFLTRNLFLCEICFFSSLFKLVLEVYYKFWFLNSCSFYAGVIMEGLSTFDFYDNNRESQFTCLIQFRFIRVSCLIT